jgi:hypothetical protein
MVSGSGVCAKRIMVDARHHMLGRLSSVIAKELLNGQKAIVVHYEEISRKSSNRLSTLVDAGFSKPMPLSSGRRDVWSGPGSWDRGLRTSP